MSVDAPALRLVEAAAHPLAPVVALLRSELDVVDRLHRDRTLSVTLPVPDPEVEARLGALGFEPVPAWSAWIDLAGLRGLDEALSRMDRPKRRYEVRAALARFERAGGRVSWSDAADVEPERLRGVYERALLPHAAARGIDTHGCNAAARFHEVMTGATDLVTLSLGGAPVAFGAVRRQAGAELSSGAAQLRWTRSVEPAEPAAELLLAPTSPAAELDLSAVLYARLIERCLSWGVGVLGLGREAAVSGEAFLGVLFFKRKWGAATALAAGGVTPRMFLRASAGRALAAQQASLQATELAGEPGLRFFLPARALRRPWLRALVHGDGHVAREAVVASRADAALIARAGDDRLRVRVWSGA